MDSALDQLPDDIAALKAMILSQRTEAVQLAASVKAYEALVQALKIRIARLRKQKFGRSSEKIEREIEQLERKRRLIALVDLQNPFVREGVSRSQEMTDGWNSTKLRNFSQCRRRICWSYRSCGWAERSPPLAGACEG